MKSKYKKIITDRGDEFYVKYSVGSGYSSNSVYCHLYRKRKIPFLYKKLKWVSESSISTKFVSGKVLPEITDIDNDDEIPVEMKKRMAKKVVKKYYDYIDTIEKNRKDSEEWDGVMGNNMRREKRLEKLLDNEDTLEN